MRLVSLVSGCGTALLSVSARACTVCDSPTGHQLRAGLFDGHFVRTMCLVAAPVPIFVAALLLLHRFLPAFDETAPPALGAAGMHNEFMLPEAAA